MHGLSVSSLGSSDSVRPPPNLGRLLFSESVNAEVSHDDGTRLALSTEVEA